MVDPQVALLGMLIESSHVSSHLEPSIHLAVASSHLHARDYFLSPRCVIAGRNGVRGVDHVDESSPGALQCARPSSAGDKWCSLER